LQPQPSGVERPPTASAAASTTGDASPSSPHDEPRDEAPPDAAFAPEADGRAERPPPTSPPPEAPRAPDGRRSDAKPEPGGEFGLVPAPPKRPGRP
ncbi:MAG TPA: hypothetical protein VGW10_18885, partial [Solirubrobacteraceae bacterium]|nr:hypothetical protein [Solirubrobacteraceae bacterium]